LEIGNRYSFSAAILYLGFMVGAYPAMTLAQRFPIERVASCIITLWGICLILTPVCFNYQTLYVQRFFLGMLEAGVSPMFMLIVVSMAPDPPFTPARELTQQRVVGIKRTNRHSAWGKKYP
jgi:MFS family permease